MNPLDAVIQHPSMRKEAVQLPLPGMGRGLGQMASDFAMGARGAFNPSVLGGEVVKGMAGHAGSLALGAVALAAVPAAKKIWDSLESKRVYKEMMQLSPELEGLRQNNPETFSASYNAIRRLNPVYSKDPLVAGAMMSRMNHPEADGNTRLQLLAATTKPPEAAKSMQLQHKLGPVSLAYNI